MGRRTLLALLLAAATTGCAGPALPGGTSPANVSPSPSVACPSAPLECLQGAVTDAANQGQFAGAILVARDGEPIWQDAFGTHGVPEQPRSLDTPFVVASVGKMFTSVSVAQLVATGSLSFEDPIDLYVADLPSDVGQATIGQLLSHTSGMGMYDWTSGLVCEAGTFNYSNAGFVLLAIAVENVTEQTFAEYLRPNVFQPVGMTTTDAADRPRGSPSGAGGETSTVGDLLRFANALFAYQLVDQPMTEQITSMKASTELGGYAYGFGIFTGENDEVPSVGHIGVGQSGVTAVEISPALGYTIIVYANRGFDRIQPALIAYQAAIGMGYWRG